MFGGNGYVAEAHEFRPRFWGYVEAFKQPSIVQWMNYSMGFIFARIILIVV